MSFVHLHVHSNFSLLQGAFSIAELVEAAARAGMPAVALTDTNGLYGAVKFYEAAREAGIKPIIGAEIVSGADQCICLAADREGYSNLCRIVTERRLGGSPATFDLCASVAAHAEGLFVLSATPSVLTRLRGAVPEGRLYAELRADGEKSFETRGPALSGADGALRASGGSPSVVAYELGIPLAATVNVNLLRPEDRETHAVVSAIRENRNLNEFLDEGRLLAGERSFFQSPAQVLARLPEEKAALRNTLRIAEACELELDLETLHFPQYDRLPRGRTACAHLREVAYRGARGRYGKLTRSVRERLERELDVIAKLGFCHYFLVVWNIVEFARREGIPHVGRGSAGNSIVSYVLGISEVDPLRFDLYFERFLNEYRTDMPDIDIDFSWRRRDEVIDYVYRRYPVGQVAMVSTHSTLRARSAFRDVARVMGLPLGEIDRYSPMLPHHDVSSVEEAMETFPEMADLPIGREPWRTVLARALRVDGYVRHLSIHLGGMVIGDGPLTRYTALENSAKGIVVTQYEMDSVEKIGLVKIDLLGQRSLTIVAEAAAAVEREHGVKIDLDRLPDGDPRAAALLRRGRTMGCFQIESPGMRQLLQMLRADCIMDVIQGLSLIRPGPIGSGMKGAFIRRKRGLEPVTYLAPQMEDALRQTYGVMLYQEDILKVSQAVAGFSMAVGDELRKRITKARSHEAIREMREQFMTGAGARDVPAEVARRIWGQIESFAAYSYCKAHATTYGHISYQAAWLKAHYPAEFLAAVIANKAGFYDPQVYYRDARRFNVRVLGQSVNESDIECRAEDGAIRPGLETVRSLSVRTIQQILEQRLRGPFASLEDFCARVRLTRRELENLILCGAFDWTGRTRPTLLIAAHLLHPGGAEAPHSNRVAGASRPCSASLFASLQPAPLSAAEASPYNGVAGASRPGSASLVASLQPGPISAAEDGGTPSLPERVPPRPEFPLPDRVRWELTLLGMTHSGHPLDMWDGELDERGLARSYELPKLVGRRVSFVGWLVMMRHALTAKHEYMKFLCLEDRHGVVEVVIFPDVYRRYGRETDSAGAYRIEGKVEEQHGAVNLVAERVHRLAHPSSSSWSHLAAK